MGGSYSLVILIVLAYMAWYDFLPTSGWGTMWLGAAVIIGLRMGCEHMFGSRWDAIERRRQQLVAEGAEYHQAVQQVQDVDTA